LWKRNIQRPEVKKKGRKEIGVENEKGKRNKEKKKRK
jgi:hypothetical protein